MTAAYTDGRLVVSTSLLGHLLSVDDRTVQRWAKDGCPQFARGKWDIKQVLEWRGLAATSNADDDALTPRDEKIRYDALYKKAQTEAAEFKNDLMSGRYIEREAATADLRRFFVVLKRSLMGLSRRVATEASAHMDLTEARRLEARITDIVMGALGQMSVDGVYYPEKQKKE